MSDLSDYWSSQWLSVKRFNVCSFKKKQWLECAKLRQFHPDTKGLNLAERNIPWTKMNSSITFQLTSLLWNFSIADIMPSAPTAYLDPRKWLKCSRHVRCTWLPFIWYQSVIWPTWHVTIRRPVIVKIITSAPWHHCKVRESYLQNRDSRRFCGTCKSLMGLDESKPIFRFWLRDLAWSGEMAS